MVENPEDLGLWVLPAEYGADLDDLWVRLCVLYREKKLAGVCSMKVTTMKMKMKKGGQGFVYLYCGPDKD